MYPKWLHILLAVYPCISALGEVIPQTIRSMLFRKAGIPVLYWKLLPFPIAFGMTRKGTTTKIPRYRMGRCFHQEPGISIILAIRAVLIPTQSVIRIHAFQTHPELYYGSFASLFEVKLSNDQYNSLISFISNSFIRDKDGETNPFPIACR